MFWWVAFIEAVKLNSCRHSATVCCASFSETFSVCLSYSRSCASTMQDDTLYFGIFKCSYDIIFRFQSTSCMSALFQFQSTSCMSALRSTSVDSFWEHQNIPYKIDWNCYFVGLLHNPFWLQLILPILGQHFLLLKSLSLAKEYWWGFNTQNAHMHGPHGRTSKNIDCRTGADQKGHSDAITNVTKLTWLTGLRASENLPIWLNKSGVVENIFKKFFKNIYIYCLIWFFIQLSHIECKVWEY